MKYYIANWKMNLNLSDITKWIETFTQKSSVVNDQKKVIIAASFPYLALLHEAFKNSPNIVIGAQNVAPYPKGAYTGEVSAVQLHDFCKYSIVGHSERKEDIETIKKKRDLCLEFGITPIVCFVTEDAGKELYHPNALMAWEDPANISVNGIYKAKNPIEIREGAKRINFALPKGTTIVYGGSVNRDNRKEISQIEELTGVLVGNASNDPLHFADIISNY